MSNKVFIAVSPAVSMMQLTNTYILCDLVPILRPTAPYSEFGLDTLVGRVELNNAEPWAFRKDSTTSGGTLIVYIYLRAASYCSRGAHCPRKNVRVASSSRNLATYDSVEYPLCSAVFASWPSRLEDLGSRLP